MVKVKRKHVPYEENHKNIDDVIYKLCSDCDKWLPMKDDYYKNKSAPDGFNPYCKQCTKTKSRGWAINNQKHHKETRAEWYQENKERLLEKQKYLDEKNKEQKEIYSQQYRKSEHGKKKYYEYGINRKPKNHKITDDEWDSCKQYFNYSCAYCDLRIDSHYKKYAGELKQIDLNKEHVDDDGANDLSNCVPSCHSCNSKKRTKDFNDWYNESNENYTKERYDKIIQWLENDHKLYIKTK